MAPSSLENFPEISNNGLKNFIGCPAILENTSGRISGELSYKFPNFQIYNGKRHNLVGGDIIRIKIRRKYVSHCYQPTL